MPVFSQIPGATVVLKSGGVYRQAEVYRYGNRLFARYGGGYVALHKESCGGFATSAPKVSWESLEGVQPITIHAQTSLYLKES